MTLAPDAVVLGDDPGDDTASRYHYQWTYAAVLCCMLLDDTSEVAEVFCEHHEDVLIKRRDGTFVGAQIKTRSTSQSAWKTTDDGVRGSCVRFARLEARFPGHFSGFLFLSNHPLHSAKNGQDLAHVLSLVASASSEQDLVPVAKRFVKAVAKDAGCSESIAFTALRKTSADDGLPKLRGAGVRLVDTLASAWSRANECAYASVQRVADHLIAECGRASSLAHEQVLPAYLPAMPDPQAIGVKALVDGKRIDKDRLLGVLDQAIDHVATLDSEAAAICPEVLGSGRISPRYLEFTDSILQIYSPPQARKASDERCPSPDWGRLQPNIRPWRFPSNGEHPR